MKLNKFLFIMLALFCAFATSCVSTSVGDLISGTIGNRGSSQQKEIFSNADAISAMKDALTEGIVSSSNTLSAAYGYFGNAALKILLPPEANTLISYIDKIPGGQKLVEDVILRINVSAENAAKEVVPIFQEAITSMTVADGIAIVCGADDAATTYLREKTFNSLIDLYRPKVASALSKPLVLGISADTAWTELVTKYNEVAGPVNLVARIAGKSEPMPKVEVDLATYATGKALDGLFIKIGEEELKIRENPFDYVSNMIKKVYGAIKNGLVSRQF